MKNIRIIPSTLLLIAFLLPCVTSFAADAPKPKSLGDLTGPWQLLVDDSVVAEKSNLKRTYHPFKKHTANPVLKPNRPWEGETVYIYGTILPGEDGRGYRMWYHAYTGEYRNLYATSDDGINWTKPNLGLVEHKGSKQNNMLPHRTHEEHLPQVIHTPWEKDPARRYKMMCYEYGRTPPKYTTSGYYGAYSPDGIHWTDVSGNPDKPAPVLKDPGDVGNFVWDPHTGRYIGYPKKFTTVRGFRRRCVGFSATRNFQKWPESKMILVPDEIDDFWVKDDKAHTDFYGLSGFAYESGYIGFLWIFRITDGKNDGPIWCELVSSRDGVKWTRQEPQNNSRLSILALGPEGTWDDGMIFTPNHPLAESDTIKLFYGGFDATHGAATAGGAIGLATLRKDGFASLDAGDQQGQLTTKPLANTSGRLRINCDAQRGWIKVAVLDAAGKTIKGYAMEDCTPVRKNGVDLPVTWGKLDNLPATDSPLRLRFVLKNASLYSFAAGDKLKLAP